MKELKGFPSEAVLTIYVDVMLCDNFSIVHDCYNHLFGASIPTFLLSKSAVVQSCRNRIEAQVPNISDGCAILGKFETVNQENIAEIKRHLHASLGELLLLAKGSGEPDEWPQAA